MTRFARAALYALMALPTLASAAQPPAAPPRSGRAIYADFRAGLAEPSCDGEASSARWRNHFAAAPGQLAARDDDVLALFGYVVAALREASLPTEYALIPFVESGYKPGARSPGGPAGLWQMITITARNHAVPIRAGYDGRLSPVDSTRAAVRYLKTLHGMFAGDWRLAVMAYNAGEYRVFGALKRSGQTARNANPDKLVGLSGITTSYVRKLHALSCLLDQADERDAWLHALDRPVPMLDAVVLPPDTTSLDQWARANGQDPVRLRRLNPAFVDGRVARGDRAQRVLVPVDATPPSPDVQVVIDKTVASKAAVTQATPESATPVAAPRTHTVGRGDSAWKIAHRYGLSLAQLRASNGLDARSRLHPGMVLRLEPLAILQKPAE